MSEIEIEVEVGVGEYVRTYEGYIGILKEINKKNYNYLTIDVQNKVRKDGLVPSNYIYLKNKNIKKYSKNIIDLIEVGDYVNGMLIEDIEELDNKKIFYSNGEMIAWTNRDKGIETIWTKEQLKSIEYNI